MAYIDKKPGVIVPRPVEGTAVGEDAVEVLLPDMISIPAGSFYMGTSEDQIKRLVRIEEWAEWYDRDLFVNEVPLQRVELPAYEIARIPVTNLEYQRFVWDTNHDVPNGWLGFRFALNTEVHPVTGISHLDAQAYCRWISERLGGEFRLPTEAEWERASRGDLDARLYPWGDAFDPWRCNTKINRLHNPSQVGEFSPGGDSPWGGVDMVGNVWEWTSSRFMPYPYNPKDGREEPGDEVPFVIRGGAWYYSHRLARCASREGAHPKSVSPALGFRLARSV